MSEGVILANRTSCPEQTAFTVSGPLMTKGGERVKAYELLVIINPTLSDEDRAAALERVTGLVTAGDSTLDNVDEWGKRKLSFEIDKLTDGDYVLFDFHAEPAAITEVDRVLRITDSIVRFMIVRRDDKE
jgi:small subunit ribosomal protein S6